MREKQLYDLFTLADRNLFAHYKYSPIYAARLCLYLYMYPRRTAEQLAVGTGLSLSETYRVTSNYLRNYLSVDTEKGGEAKKPYNVYSLSTQGVYYVEDLLKEVNSW